MDVFETAMKMEQDGRAYYLENAEKTKSPALKKVLLELADDELKHYNIFKAMRDRQPAEYKEEEKTTIFDTIRNVFEDLKAKGEDFGSADEVREVWEKARGIEKDSEEFYRSKADGLGDDQQKTILNRIADEEHRHWVTIDQVMQFLDRPREYVEDAEWSRLDDSM